MLAPWLTLSDVAVMSMACWISRGARCPDVAASHTGTVTVPCPRQMAAAAYSIQKARGREFTGSGALN